MQFRMGLRWETDGCVSLQLDSFGTKDKNLMMRLGNLLKILILCGVVIHHPGCGFSPECVRPENGTLSYPVDGVIKEDELLVLNSDQNFEYCSSFISVFRIGEDGLPRPFRVVTPPEGEDFVLAGRIVLSPDGKKIFVTERGNGNILVFSSQGEFLDLYTEGGNPYSLAVASADGREVLATANLTEKTVTLYGMDKKMQRERVFHYSYIPTSLVFHPPSRSFVVGFAESSILSLISLNNFEVRSLILSASEEIKSVRSMVEWGGRIYAGLDNPFSLLVIDPSSPSSSSLLSIVKSRIFSLEIIKEENLLLVISPSGDMAYAFSLTPFYPLWSVEIKGSPVRGIYSPLSRLIYFITMSGNEIKVFDPHTRSFR